MKILMVTMAMDIGGAETHILELSRELKKRGLDITIASNGTITVKKGLKKGKYKFVVNVTAAGNGNYNTITKAATVKITVK